jgi:hypothetical protein
MTITLDTLEADGKILLEKLPTIAADLADAAFIVGFIPGAAAAELAVILTTAAKGATALSAMSPDFLQHLSAVMADIQKVEGMLGISSGATTQG